MSVECNFHLVWTLLGSFNANNSLLKLGHFGYHGMNSKPYFKNLYLANLHGLLSSGEKVAASLIPGRNPGSPSSLTAIFNSLKKWKEIHSKASCFSLVFSVSSPPLVCQTPILIWQYMIFHHPWLPDLLKPSLRNLLDYHLLCSNSLLPIFHCNCAVIRFTFQMAT